MEEQVKVKIKEHLEKQNELFNEVLEEQNELFNEVLEEQNELFNEALAELEVDVYDEQDD